MTTDLKYQLWNGFVHNWLVAGSLTVPVGSGFPDLVGQAKLEVIKKFTDPEAGITEIPVDLGSLGAITKENPWMTWRYYRCRDDHYVDLSASYPTCQYLRSWVYTQVAISTGRDLEIELTTNAAMDFWLNENHYCRLENIQDLSPARNKMSVALKTGMNEFLFRLENVGIRETLNGMALRFIGTANDVDIVIPTNIEPELMEKRLGLERLIDAAYLDRYVYGNLWGDRYNRNQSIPLYFSKEPDISAEITVRLQSLAGDIFQEGTKEFGAGSSFEFAKKFPLRNGPHHLALVPRADEYYIKNIRFDRKYLFHIVRTPYSQNSYGNYKERLKEALSDAAQRRNESIYCEIAKIANGQWQQVDKKIILQTYNRIYQRAAGSIHDLLGILGLMHRFRKGGKIPGEIKTQFKASILNYRYWVDEPGNDVMDFLSESEQILFHTCEILAGQLYPDRKFMNANQNGAWHQEHGERLALDWLRQHGQYGFCEWDSPGSYEAIIAALSHLVDLASSDTIRELAAILMDKLLFSMAINSFYGAFGSTRGVTDTASVLSSRLEPTSGIYRLMLGMGNFNENIMGTVSLACCKQYELPEIIQKIGAESPATFWNREHHGRPEQSSTPVSIDKVTYRTKDYMLSSAQDYHPGEKGHREHIWQATLGPDSVVYVNHPSCTSEEDFHQPNYWAGNGILPRVVQWGGVLIAIYNLPSDDWLGYTHAYFPVATFDEYLLHGKWAFARKGDGYLAITAAQGFEFIQDGQSAFRELRSYGTENVWLCHMGQKLLDDSFEDFQQKIENMNVNFDHLSICVNSLRGDTLYFGWNSSFEVNNQEQAITGMRHYDNIYCVTEYPISQMDIIYKEEGLRLRFE